MLRDTAARITACKKQVEEQASEDRAAAAVHELRAESERRYMTLAAEYDLYKSRTEDAAAAARREAQARVDALALEVDTGKRGFKDAMQVRSRARSLAPP